MTVVLAQMRFPFASVEIKVNEVHFPGYRRKQNGEDGNNSITEDNGESYAVSDSGVLF